jgi:hypothetical protein
MKLSRINYSGKDLKVRSINLVYILGSNKDLKSIEFTSKITKGTQKKSTHTSIADKNYISVGIFTGKLIEKGNTIWLDKDNNIIIGWRGSYSPPTTR